MAAADIDRDYVPRPRPLYFQLRGAMDSVSDFESGGCGFESRRSCRRTTIWTDVESEGYGFDSRIGLSRRSPQMLWPSGLNPVKRVTRGAGFRHQSSGVGSNPTNITRRLPLRPIGATVARQIPVLKVTCSNHVSVRRLHRTHISGRPIGATAARQIPVLKVTCSNHVSVIHERVSTVRSPRSSTSAGRSATKTSTSSATRVKLDGPRPSVKLGARRWPSTRPLNWRSGGIDP